MSEFAELSEADRAQLRRLDAAVADGGQALEVCDLPAYLRARSVFFRAYQNASPALQELYSRDEPPGSRPERSRGSRP